MQETVDIEEGLIAIPARNEHYQTSERKYVDLIWMLRILGVNNEKQKQDHTPKPSYLISSNMEWLLS